MLLKDLSVLRLALWILAHSSDEDYRAAVTGDCEELYEDQVARLGRLRAFLWVSWQILRSAPLLLTNSIYWGAVMLKNYLRIAFRNQWRYKGYSTINIAGLAVGMAVCMMIFLWVQHELSFDRFHAKADRIYRVVENQEYEGGQIFPVAVTPAPLAPALVTEMPEVMNAARYHEGPRLLVRHGDNRFYEDRVSLADQSFLEMFTFPFAEGDSKTALSAPTSIVLTRSMARRYFGEADPVGETIKIENRFDLTVTGVMEDVRDNSHLQFDGLISFGILATIGESMDEWGTNGYYTYAELADRVSMEAVSPKIAGFVKKHEPDTSVTLLLQPLSRIHLHSDFAADIGGHGDIKYVFIFSAVALFILLTACINFVNLTTARSGNRSKEVGVRKVTGAHRADIIEQFILESILSSLLAFVLALAMVWLLLPAFSRLSGKELSLSLIANPVVPLGLIATALVAALLSGSYPALFLSSFQPIKVLRGSFRLGARSAYFRRVLVVIQFALSVLLMISTGVVKQQLDFIQSKKLGFEKEHVLFLELSERTCQSYEALRNDLLLSKGILGVTVADQLPTTIMNSTSDVSWPGKTPGSTVLVHNQSVDYGYFETMKMEFAAGRPFSRQFGMDETAFVLNETAVTMMGLDSPIGASFTLHDKTGPIVGVVKDFHFKSFSTAVEPLVISLFKPADFVYALVRIDPQNIPQTLDDIRSNWQRVAPEYPFHYQFLSERFDRLYRAESQMGSLFTWFTALALFIACLGLLGLASFMAEQRTREIGIRKVLGASVKQIVLLLSREFVALVAISNLIAWPVAYYYIQKWLGGYAYHARLGADAFVFSAVMALVIAVSTVSYQAVRAAIAPPVRSLRCE